MTHREKSPSDLIFEALCLRFRSTTNIGKTMTRQELQEATGLTAEALVDALRVLVAVGESVRGHGEARMIAALSARKSGNTRSRGRSAAGSRRNRSPLHAGR